MPVFALLSNYSAEGVAKYHLSHYRCREVSYKEGKCFMQIILPMLKLYIH
jgi:hypothetical protein